MGVTSDINTVITSTTATICTRTSGGSARIPVHPPLRVEQHGPDGNGPRRIPLHPGDYEFQVRWRRRWTTSSAPGGAFSRRRVRLLHAALRVGVDGSAQDNQGRGALHPLPRLQGIHPQKSFLHGRERLDACRSTRSAGHVSMAKTTKARALADFETPGVIAEVLGHEPSPELLSRLLARRAGAR